jgi:hypothetical protein
MIIFSLTGRAKLRDFPRIRELAVCDTIILSSSIDSQLSFPENINLVLVLATIFITASVQT